MKIRQYLNLSVHRIWQGKGLLSTLLTPLALIVGIYTRHKRQHFTRHPSRVYYSHTPVIVVGNLIVGGAGKTPVVMALIDVLRASGFTPGVISRGYGVEIGPQARTTKTHHAAAELGDEPALIHQKKHVPVAVHPKRILALQALNHDFPDVDVVISDDGLQHLALGRHAEVIVQDQRGIANGRLLPAGPLREAPARLNEATVVINQITADQQLSSTANHYNLINAVQMRLWPNAFTALQSAERLNLTEALKRFKSSNIVACAAIGQPQRFFTMLRTAGFNLTESHAFPDHYDYSNNPFSDIKADYIFITAKDAVKCKKLDDSRLWVVEAETQFSTANWAAPLLKVLSKKL